MPSVQPRVAIPSELLEYRHVSLGKLLISNFDLKAELQEGRGLRLSQAPKLFSSVRTTAHALTCSCK